MKPPLLIDLAHQVRQIISAHVEQPALGFGAAFGKRGFEPLRDGGPQFMLAAGAVSREPFELARDRLSIDQLVQTDAVTGMIDREIHAHPG